MMLVGRAPAREDGAVIVDCAVYTEGRRRQGRLPVEEALVCLVLRRRFKRIGWL